jgi:hypothetical protein
MPERADREAMEEAFGPMWDDADPAETVHFEAGWLAHARRTTEGEPTDAMCVCGHTMHWHGPARDCQHDGECRCRWFEDAHDERCMGDCGPCGGDGGVADTGPNGEMALTCLTCGGSGKCPGCSPAYMLRRARAEIDDLRAAPSRVSHGLPDIRVIELEPVLRIVERLLALDLPQCQFVEDAEALVARERQR